MCLNLELLQIHYFPNIDYKQSIMYIPIRKIQHLIGKKKSTLIRIENNSDTTITTSDKTRIIRKQELHQMIRIKGYVRKYRNSKTRNTENIRQRNM